MNFGKAKLETRFAEYIYIYFMRIKKFVMRKKRTRYFKCEQCEKK